MGYSIFNIPGSHSSDIQGVTLDQNPLTPCPDSPNCIRLTKQIDLPIEDVFTFSQKTLEKMGPVKLRVSHADYKMESIFRVFFFKDDMVLQCTKKDAEHTLLHIRSASRVGYSDLGVNTRRVKRFLKKLQQNNAT